MLEDLARYWWLLTIRGALGILFGLMAWIWPEITVWALIVLFGCYAIVDGGFAIGAAIRGGPGQSRTWQAVTGAAGIILGIVVLAWPKETSLVLLLLIAWWAVITGIFEIVAGVGLSRQHQSGTIYIITGGISIIFGVLLFIWPVHGALAVIWIIGLFSILFGIAMIVGSLNLRKLAQPPP